MESVAEPRQSYEDTLAVGTSEDDESVHCSMAEMDAEDTGTPGVSFVAILVNPRLHYGSSNNRAKVEA